MRQSSKASAVIMALLALALFVVPARQACAQDVRVSINMTNASMRDVMFAIQTQTRYLFGAGYDVDLDRQVSVNVSKQPLRVALDQMVAGTDLVYEFNGTNIIISKASAAAKRDNSANVVTGKVSDPKGEPIPGAYVVIKNTKKGTSTELDGTFALEVDANAILQISCLGYISKEVTVGTRNSVNVVLAEDSQALDELVVVAYGTQKKRDVIGSMATLSSSDVMKSAPVSVEGALQGMASGVTVNSGDGMPGAPQQIKIRGIGSISSGTDPLWVVDGIPVQSNSMDVSFNYETHQSVISMFNPSDIESIQVLKDAAATAIYGSRGSNGVILVTTKSGKQGALKVTADIKAGVSSWAKTDVGFVTSGKDYIDIMSTAVRNAKIGDSYQVSSAVSNLDGGTDTISQEAAMSTSTDWGKLLSRTGSFKEVNLSASQGSERGNAYMSIKMRDEKANIKYAQLKTISGTTNLNYKFTKWLDFGFKMFATYTDNDRVKSGEGKANAGGWAQVNANALPWMPVYNDAGSYWNSIASVNALALIDPANSQSNLVTLNVLSSANATIHLPVKGLSVTGNYGLNYVGNRARSWRSDMIVPTGADAEERKVEANIVNYNAFINYDVPLGDLHALNLVAGVENTRQWNHFMNVRGSKLVGIFPEVGTPSVISGRTGIDGESYLRGYFARANYKLMERYLFGASYRRDGISKFTAENRWADFLSFSAGWIISDESFFNIPAVNLLKIRGSFGQTGNTNIPSNITGDMYFIETGRETLTGFNNTRLKNIGNSDIKWETTNQIDAGIDYGLFDNRINGSIAWYQKKVSDMLLFVTLPPSAGIFNNENGIWQNIGDMVNNGIEFDINGTIINHEDLTLTAGFNISTNANKVLSLDPITDNNGSGMFLIGEGAYTYGINRTITKKDLPFGTWYMAESAGVDPQKGIPMIYEVEVDPATGDTRHTGNIIPATASNMTNNRMILKGKTSMPKVFGGFNANLCWRNFDFGMVWSFAAGNYIYNHLLQSSMIPNQGFMVLNERLLNDSWKQPGDNAKWPMVTAANNYYYDDAGNPVEKPVSFGGDNKSVNSMYLEKGDYLKLRNVTLGYNLPKSWLRTINLPSARVYLSASNLLTITGFSGYDPEIAVDPTTGCSVSSFYNMPASRSFMLGVTLNF